MGLDISYYQFIEPVKGDDDIELDAPNERVIAWYTAGFDDRLDGIEAKFVKVSGRQGHFRAGSYSGYGHWRRLLSLVALDVEPHEVWARPLKFKGRPFYELIDFSDCEGCIGPKTSAKLSVDFTAYMAKFHNSSPESYYVKQYHLWAEAFRVAAKHGCVDFH